MKINKDYLIVFRKFYLYLGVASIILSLFFFIYCDIQSGVPFYYAIRTVIPFSLLIAGIIFFFTQLFQWIIFRIKKVKQKNSITSSLMIFIRIFIVSIWLIHPGAIGNILSILPMAKSSIDSLRPISGYESRGRILMNFGDSFFGEGPHPNLLGFSEDNQYLLYEQRGKEYKLNLKTTETTIIGEFESPKNKIDQFKKLANIVIPTPYEFDIYLYDGYREISLKTGSVLLLCVIDKDDCLFHGRRVFRSNINIFDLQTKRGYYSFVVSPDKSLIAVTYPRIAYEASSIYLLEYAP